jgi:hypothetical protein
VANLFYLFLNPQVQGLRSDWDAIATEVNTNVRQSLLNDDEFVTPIRQSAQGEVLGSKERHLIRVSDGLLTQADLDALLKDKAKLTAVLTYHVVPGAVMAKDVKAGTVKTVQGGMLTIGTTGGVTVNVTHTGVAAGAFIATNVSGFDSRPWVLVCTAAGTTSKLWIKSPDGLVQFHSQAAGIAAGTGTIDLSTTGGSVGLSLAACSNRCVADAYAVELVNNPWLLFDDEVFYVPRAAPPAGVTISNVTATGITATGATPRYTIDLP